MYKQPLISIITPAYNVADYLPGCLDSILSQTFHDYELILIDDGSTDDTGKICDEYAARDPRIRVIHQDNIGVSDSWNKGVALAEGEYIGFVDSDDFIHEEMYEILYKAVTETQSDIAFCDFKKYMFDIKNAVFDERTDYHFRISSTEEELRSITQPYSAAFIWKGLYRKECIKDIRFLSGYSIQDRMWSPIAVLHAKRIVRVDRALYMHLIRSGSNSRRDFSQNYTDAFYVHCRLLDYLKENAPEWVPLFTLNLFSYCLNTLIKMHRIHYQGNPSDLRKGIKDVMSYLSELSLTDIIEERYTDTTRKAIAIAGKISFPLAYTIKRSLLGVHDLMHPLPG
ncbi:MAG: glycosyltransferase [Solobacterium sp.]|nr:glycosyltransferase [Solobacterium sp.]